MSWELRPAHIKSAKCSGNYSKTKHFKTSCQCHISPQILFNSFHWIPSNLFSVSLICQGTSNQAEHTHTHLKSNESLVEAWCRICRVSSRALLCQYTASTQIHVYLYFKVCALWHLETCTGNPHFTPVTHCYYLLQLAEVTKLVWKEICPKVYTDTVAHGIID